MTPDLETIRAAKSKIDRWKMGLLSVRQYYINLGDREQIDEMIATDAVYDAITFVLSFYEKALQLEDCICDGKAMIAQIQKEVAGGH